MTATVQSKLRAADARAFAWRRGPHQVTRLRQIGLASPDRPISPTPGPRDITQVKTL